MHMRCIPPSHRGPAALAPFLLVAVFAFLPSPALAQMTKADVASFLDARTARLSDVAMQIWDFAEVGYQETRSSALLAAELEAAGFTVQRGVAGIPTAFVASYGSGKPVIGILGEFDALPGINQDRVPERQPIEGKAAGHACGHNLLGTASSARPSPLPQWLEATGQCGTIRFYGTPAEEGGSGKVYMVRAGLFDDVDAVPHLAPRRPQRRQPRLQPGGDLGEVPLPRRVVARRRRPRPRPLGAGRRGGHGLHGQHDARARPAGDAHPLRHHQRRGRAQRRARLRRGLLLRAPPRPRDGALHLRPAGGGGEGAAPGHRHHEWTTRSWAASYSRFPWTSLQQLVYDNLKQVGGVDVRRPGAALRRDS